ncbi:VanZ family protein [Clostridium thermarum]|uniref:VanZ family protein n=1 Tax=Clostridium thermarum TaxID=1716543 RepID=UPI0013D590A8|nr:VanZ family protein [Clostridium thermarum]
MNKRKMKVLLLIAWMIIIFLFSQQPADVSNENNEFIVYIFDLLGIDLNGAFGAFTDFVIRKAAHFTEYFILYILFFNVFNEKNSLTRALIYSLVGVFLYACTDEFHQLFVPGRSGKAVDVLIDTTGGLVALTTVYIHSIFKMNPSK